jgi:hypothetical protein
MNKFFEGTGDVFGGLGILAAALNIFVFSTGVAAIVCETVMSVFFAAFFVVTIIDAILNFSQSSGSDRELLKLKIGFSAIGLLSIISVFLLPPLGLASVISAIIFTAAVSLAALVAIQITNVSTSKIIEKSQLVEPSNNLSLVSSVSYPPPALPLAQNEKSDQEEKPSLIDKIKNFGCGLFQCGGSMFFKPKVSNSPTSKAPEPDTRIDPFFI